MVYESGGRHTRRSHRPRPRRNVGRIRAAWHRDRRMGNGEQISESFVTERCAMRLAWRIDDDKSNSPGCNFLVSRHTVRVAFGASAGPRIGRWLLDNASPRWRTQRRSFQSAAEGNPHQHSGIPLHREAIGRSQARRSPCPKCAKVSDSTHSRIWSSSATTSALISQI